MATLGKKRDPKTTTRAVAAVFAVRIGAAPAVAAQKRAMQTKQTARLKTSRSLLAKCTIK